MNAPVVVAFIVVERVKSKRGELRDKPVSRRYHVRTAAEECAALLRKDARDCFVQSVTGSPS